MKSPSLVVVAHVAALITVLLWGPAPVLVAVAVALVVALYGGSRDP